MSKNVGAFDRVLRIVLGLALLGCVVAFNGNARWWGLIGVVPLLTGLVGACPLYSVLGISTCEVKKASP